jgi:hypothetical protein
MAFISSDIYPKWKGNLLVGSLKFQYVEMLFTGDKITGRQKIATDVKVCVTFCKVLMATFTFGVEGKGIPKIIPKLI